MVIYGKESRRAKGEGSIYARANGTYAIKYNGKYRYAKTKTEAREKLEEMKLEEKLALNDRTKMATAVQEWLDTKVLSLKPTSYDRLERTVRMHIIPNVGKMQCGDFTERTFIQDILKPMKDKGLAYSSIKKAQDAICAFCKWASAPSRRYMQYDPMASFDKITKMSLQNNKSNNEEDASEVVFLNKDDRKRFVSTCRLKWNSGRMRFPHGEALIFDLYTPSHL